MFSLYCTCIDRQPFTVIPLAMYARELLDRSFFLFGPRGTGKTAWLQTVLPTG